MPRRSSKAVEVEETLVPHSLSGVQLFLLFGLLGAILSIVFTIAQDTAQLRTMRHIRIDPLPAPAATPQPPAEPATDG